MAGYMLVLNKLATEKTIFKVVKGHPKVSLKKMEKQTKINKYSNFKCSKMMKIFILVCFPSKAELK